MTETAPGRALRTVLIAGLVVLMAFCGFLVLAIAGIETGPVAFPLALTLAVLPVPVYIAAVLFMDRYEPEPVPMVLLTFAWGATVAAFVALVVNTVGESLVSQQYGSDIAQLYGYSISAPIVEETAKGLVLFGIYRFYRSEFNGILDGIVYAALVGLGFAMTENVLYYGRGALEQGIPGAIGTFVVRGLISPFAHPVFTSMTGIGLGIASTSRSPTVRVAAPLGGLALAMFLHSLWNTAAGSGLFFGVYVLVMIPLLIFLAVLVVVSLRREGRVIAMELRGTLPPDEVEALASLRERREWRREAARRGGRAAKRAMAELQRTAAELAFQRFQVERGTIRADNAARARESALLARLAALRRELAALARAGPGRLAYG